MCGGGGGSTPAPSKPAPVAKPATPVTPTIQQPAGPTQYVSNNPISSNTGGGQAGTDSTSSGPQQYIGQTGQGASGAPQSSTTFVAGQGSVGPGYSVLNEIFSGMDMAGIMGGKSPWRAATTGGSSFLQERMATNPEVVGSDASVKKQANAPEVAGGEPGTAGNVGFGSRALSGGEAVMASAGGAESNAVDSSTPAGLAPSDLAQDPNYVEPSPGKAYVADQGYNFPLVGNSMSGFLPNTRMAFERAKGPISRGLMSARTGFGRRYS